MAAIIPIPAFSDNYIWVLREGTQAAVVDPGDAAPVLDYLDARGARDLRDPRDASPSRPRRRRSPSLSSAFGAPVLRSGTRDRFRAARVRSREGDRSRRPGLHRRFVPACSTSPAIPRGTSRIVGARRTRTPVVFCGDTLFAAGCGRLFEGTPEQMWSSLGKLAALDPATQVYCGHEYTLANLRFAARGRTGQSRDRGACSSASSDKRDARPADAALDDRRERLPPIRSCAPGEPAVRAAAEAQAGHPLTDDVAVFAALRAWKNAFALQRRQVAGPAGQAAA